LGRDIVSEEERRKERAPSRDFGEISSASPKKSFRRFGRFENLAGDTRERARGKLLPLRRCKRKRNIEGCEAIKNCVDKREERERERERERVRERE